MEHTQLENNEQEKRPTFILVLCILTFINTGITILGGISGMLKGSPSAAEIKASKVQMAQSLDQLEKLKIDYWIDVVKRLQLMTDAMYANFVAYNAVAVVVALIGVAAAALMLKGRKLGFHMYIGYSFIYILQGYLFVSAAVIPSLIVILNLTIAGLFVFMYSRNLNWLKK